MAIYLLNADPDVERSGPIEHRLRTAIPELAKIHRIEDALVDQSSKEPSYILLIGPPNDAGNLDKLAAIAARHRDRAFLILIGEEIPASAYKSLVRSGGADWISSDADVQEILELLENRQTLQRSQAASAARGGSNRVAVSFVPSGGGVGNTTLAVEVGIALKTGKTTKDKSICIVDLDFQSSHACDYIVIEPRL